MTQEQFEMIEQALLNVHNETVVAIARYVRSDNTDTRTVKLSQNILETFLFKDLNELRQYHTTDIISIEDRTPQT